MSFTLNDEKATGVLIWWIEGADGSIEMEEEEAVEDLLHDLNYSMKEYREKTKLHISGLSNEKVKDLVDDAIQWGAGHFDDARQQKTINLLETISECNGTKEEEQEKLDRIKQAFKGS